MSTQWSETFQLPWCACCGEYRCETQARYTCPSCSDPVYEGRRTVAVSVPPPRMAFDARPRPISTTAGDLT